MQLHVLFSFFLYASLHGALTAAVPASKKPAVVLVPGAFHSPRVYERVTSRLSKAGYTFLDAVALPSVGHVVGRQADTDAVKKTLCR